MNNTPLNSRLIFTLLVTLISSFTYSQSNHTVTFSGNSYDFNTAEKIYGGDNVDYYVTFDDTYMYFAAFRVNSDIFNNYDHYTVYLDTDPKPSLTAGNGSTSGLNWDSNTPTMPFNADHRFVIRNNGLGESFHHKYTGASWDDQTSGLTSSFNQYTTSTALEIRIPIANIDSAKGVYFSMYMSYNGGFFGANDVNYPVSISGSTFSGYFGGIGLTNANCNPVDNKNQPIMDELVNANPVANTTYAYITINDGDYSVTGDIAIAPGGRGSISAGKSLTVNGDFENNGYFELQSISNSYSSLLTTSASGNISYKRYVNTIGSASGGGNDLISLPLMPTGLTFDSFITNGTNATDIADNGTDYAFAPYNNITASAYENFSMGATDVLLKAKGYRAATDSGDLLTFTGTPDNGTVTFPIVSPALGSEWNLIGNPYPSYVDADLFLNVTNTALLDASAVAIYAYNSGLYTGAAPTTSNFTVINKATIAALAGENFNIAPGQGFFVASNGTVGNVEFTPAMRTFSGDDDYITGRTSNESEFFKLNLIGSETYSTSIFFNTNASLGLDPGYDAVVYGEDSENYPIYSHLVEENTGRSMALQAIDNTDLTSVSIPLGVNSNQGEAITFSIDASHLSNSTQVYLEDTVANTYTLLNSGDYILTPSINLSGTGRFYLQILNATLSTVDNSLDKLNIYSNQNEKTIVIAGQLVETTTATIYDIQGRMVNNSILQNTNSSQSINVQHLNEGVYIIKLTNSEQNKTQKIIIK